jgi:hypothetical protein
MSIKLLQWSISEYRASFSYQIQNENVEEIWFELDTEENLTFSAEDASFAVWSLVPLAMNLGLDLITETTCDSTSLANIDEWQDAWVRFRPDLYQRINIVITSQEWPRPPATKSAVLAFSGGIDATYSLLRHKSGGEGFRTLDIYACVLVHGLDIHLEEVQAFSNAFLSAKTIAEQFLTPLISVRTNWRKICPDYGSSYLIGLTSTLRLFSGKCQSAVISSEMPYGAELENWGSTSSTNYLLSSREWRLVTTGFGVSRNFKSETIAKHPQILPHLRVCWQGPMTGKNCGQCPKCLITRLNFKSIGVEQVGGMAPIQPEEIQNMTEMNKIQAANFSNLLVDPRLLSQTLQDSLSKRLTKYDKSLKRMLFKNKIKKALGI